MLRYFDAFEESVPMQMQMYIACFVILMLLKSQFQCISLVFVSFYLNLRCMFLYEIVSLATEGR
jgi:hypothetical protein